MLASIPSCALSGIDAFAVAVEVSVAGGLPGYHVVGLPATSVKEGSVRIRSALEHVGQAIPSKKITVNLAPADRRKSGAAFDLPIAIGIMLAGDAAPPDGLRADLLEDLLILGELGLDGSLRPVRGALSAALLARERGMRGVLLPAASAAEAAVVDDIEVYQASHLSEVAAVLVTGAPLTRATPRPARARASHAGHGADMSEVRGQELARAALEITVAGGHNLLLIGPPGNGKTMLARRIPSILPPMGREETLETTQIYSAAGLARGELVTERPYRAPHHSISTAALLGGGSVPRPGEISLAHNGILFLDELPEFHRNAVEALRQPLEDRTVTVGRVQGTVTMPASFLLVAAANPCPCGWSGSRRRVCICSPTAVTRYRGKLSGPLMDRMDLQIFVQTVELVDLRSHQAAESSTHIRERVMRARALQHSRLARFGCRTNAEMSPAAMRATCRLTDTAESTLARLNEVRGGMTARSIDRLIRVGRTIADLLGRERIDEDCILEAAAYRALDSDVGPRAGGLSTSMAASAPASAPAPAPASARAGAASGGAAAVTSESAASEPAVSEPAASEPAGVESGDVASS